MTRRISIGDAVKFKDGEIRHPAERGEFNVVYFGDGGIYLRNNGPFKVYADEEQLELVNQMVLRGKR